MKVAIVAKNSHILPTSPNYAWAPGIVIANEAKVLTQFGVDVRVYCAKGSTVPGEVIDFDLPSSFEAFSKIETNQGKIREVFYNNAYQQLVIDHLKNNPVDLIHLHDYRDYPFYAAAHLSTPIVVTLHGDFYLNFSKLPENVKPFINEMNIIAIGKSRIPQGVKPPLAVIPNMLDLSQFPLITHPQERVVHVGRLSYGKGSDLALKAAEMAQVSIGVYGEIVGDKEWKNEFKELLEQSSQATYHGFLPHTRIAKAFDAKALLLPMREPEGFGNVVVEAMASGTPVITFGLGGTAELIKNGVNGYIVETTQEMAEAIKKIDTLDREKCRSYVLEQFSEVEIGKRLIEVFKTLVVS